MKIPDYQTIRHKIMIPPKSDQKIISELIVQILLKNDVIRMSVEANYIEWESVQTAEFDFVEC